MPSVVRTVLLCALLGSSSIPVAAAEQPTYELERIDWSGKLARGGTAVLKNRWGDVRVRQHGGSDVVLHAVMQKIGARPKVATLKHAERADRIELELVYANGAEPASVREGRIDAVLLLPAGVAAEVETDFGRVYAKTAEPLRVRATTEPVEIRSEGEVQVETVSAPVVMHLRAGSTQDRGRIVTGTGDIEVVLRSGQPARFSVVSGASRTTNSAELLASRRRDGRAVVFTRGEDPPRLFLQSDGGRVILNDLGGEHDVPAGGGEGRQSPD